VIGEALEVSGIGFLLAERENGVRRHAGHSMTGRPAKAGDPANFDLMLRLQDSNPRLLRIADKSYKRHNLTLMRQRHCILSCCDIDVSIVEEL
jgi:hypothetical protein